MNTYVCTKCSSRVCVSTTTDKEPPRFCPLADSIESNWHIAGKQEKGAK